MKLYNNIFKKWHIDGKTTWKSGMSGDSMAINNYNKKLIINTLLLLSIIIIIVSLFI